MSAYASLTQGEPRRGKAVDGPDTAPGRRSGAAAGEVKGRSDHGTDEGPEEGERAGEREAIRDVVGDGDAEGVIRMVGLDWLPLIAEKTPLTHLGRQGR